jgi:hypothetical protein
MLRGRDRFQVAPPEIDASGELTGNDLLRNNLLCDDLRGRGDLTRFIRGQRRAEMARRFFMTSSFQLYSRAFYNFPAQTFRF